MKILFYGRLAEAIGPELEVGDAPGRSVAELRARIVAEHPGMADALHGRRARAFVGDRLVNDDFRPGAGDTVEFVPPVSGG